MLTDHLSATFGALADPTRRAILARLSSGEVTVTELAEPFAMSLPAISKHLKVLERAGLVVRGRQAQWRPCRLEVAPLREAGDWIAQYRRHWEESLDRLDDYLTQLQSEAGAVETPSAQPSKKPKQSPRNRSRKGKRHDGNNGS